MTDTFDIPQNIKDRLSRIREESANEDAQPLLKWLAGISKNDDYLKLPAQRLLDAIGEPETTCAKDDPVLRNLCGTQAKIKRYPAFKDFYGIDDVIAETIEFLKGAAQGSEFSKQFLYFLGPPGSAKSSLAAVLAKLMETQYFYVLAAPKKDGEGYDISPALENPLGVIPTADIDAFSEAYKIPAFMMNGLCSAWATEMLQTRLKGDVSKFKVVKVKAARSGKSGPMGITRLEPQGETTQDTSVVVGSFDIVKEAQLGEGHPLAYTFSGALNRGVVFLEFVEMFKAPTDMLHPFLSALQDRQYNGSKSMAGIPTHFPVYVAHSNESEWKSFAGKAVNEAFKDRIHIVRVPYNLQPHLERKIYQKQLTQESMMSLEQFAPHTLEMMAYLAIASRLNPVDGLDTMHHLRIYDGENIHREKENVKSYQQLRSDSPEEAFSGISTRDMFKMLSKASTSLDDGCVDPVRMLHIFKNYLKTAAGAIKKETVNEFVDGELAEWLFKRLNADIMGCLLADRNAFLNQQVERYFTALQAYKENDEYVDAAHGSSILTGKDIESVLQNVENRLKIPGGEKKRFRESFLIGILNHQAQNNGNLPDWDFKPEFEEAFSGLVDEAAKELIPLLDFDDMKRDDDAKTKHESVVSRLKKAGYKSEESIRKVVSWWQEKRNVK